MFTQFDVFSEIAGFSEPVTYILNEDEIQYLTYIFEFHASGFWRKHNSKTRLLPQLTPQISSTNFSQTSAKLNPEKTVTIEATTTERGPVVFWCSKSSTFSGSDSNVGEVTHQPSIRGRAKRFGQPE